MGETIGGVGSPTDEAEEIGWFYRDQLPPLSDGHEPLINYGFDFREFGSVGVADERDFVHRNLPVVVWLVSLDQDFLC